jgi:hypothetical protein
MWIRSDEWRAFMRPGSFKTTTHPPANVTRMRVAVAALAVVPLFGLSFRSPSRDGAPPARAHHALAYDPVARRVVLTGGSTPRDSGRSFEFFNDLWAFDGRRWIELPASGDRLSGIRLAFDTRRARLVSWGGFDGSARGDLRVLEADGWRTIGTYADMRASEPGVAYDTRRDRLVAFGGSAAHAQARGETWEHDGTRWHRIDVAGPPPRQAHAMVFDERRGRVVVFGGIGAAAREGERPPILGDTWEYDGARWIRLDVAGPSARLAPGATYDAGRGMVVIFGGSGSGGFLGDTWGWNGTEWRRLSDVGPAPRGMGQLAYDAARDRVVLFGGRRGYPNGDLADTWEWDGTRWTRFGG